MPFFPQDDDQCGPSSLAMVLGFDGIAATPAEIRPKVYLPQREGSLQVEMLAAARRYGAVSWQLAPRLDDVLREVGAGHPVIVLQDYGVWPLHVWHYAVVVGHDRERGEVVLRSGEKERLAMPFEALEYTWRNSDRWAMVALPPDAIPASADEPGWSAAVAAFERGAPAPAVRVAYRTLLARWPSSLTGAIGLANVDYAERRLDAAETTLRAAAAAHPDSAVVLNNLAQVLSDEGRHAEALSVIDAALARGGPLQASVERTRRQILERSASGVPVPAR